MIFSRSLTRGSITKTHASFKISVKTGNEDGYLHENMNVLLRTSCITTRKIFVEGKIFQRKDVGENKTLFYVSILFRISCDFRDN
jgi:hypothetical protein